MNNTSQRDAFWTTVYEMARANPDIVVVSADMGAPSLDVFRKNLASQFVNAGIAEQNTIAVASGLTLAGKRVFTYAIAPFIALRCLEQIRVQSGLMNIPITIVGVGAGFGYADSGPTHHLLEDIAILRAIPRIVIQSITDSVMSAAVARLSCTFKTTNYVRLDRQVFPDVYKPGEDFGKGLSILKKGSDCCIVSCGNMTHAALAVARNLVKKKIDIAVMDMYSLPVNVDLFLKSIAGMKRIVTLEEHFLPGGLGSAVCEVVCDSKLTVPVERIGMEPKGYCYQYGGREALREHYGIGIKNIEKRIVDFCK
jgi:transketolase